MTVTFDSEAYSTLLIRHQPKPIRTDDDYEAAIALANALEHRNSMIPEEETLLELLLILIEKYEVIHEPIPNVSGCAVLKHLMEAQEISVSELNNILGSSTIAEQILAGQKVVDGKEAETLAKYFNVPVQVFA